MESIFNLPEIEKLFKKLSKEDELEIMFNNYKEENKLNMEDFIRATKLIKIKSKEDKIDIKQNISLDITYLHKKDKSGIESYRVSINGLKKINNLLNLVHKRSNNVILTVLMSKLDKDITVMKKTKKFNNIFDQDNLDIRFRKSQEESLNKKEIDLISNLSSDFQNNIRFRFKNRLSYLIPFSEGNISFDLTMVQSASNIQKLKNSLTDYEIEMEIYPKKDITKKGINEILDQVIIMKKVLAQNTTLVGTLSFDQVLEHYNKLIYNDKIHKGTNLYSMQPISAEVQHLIDKIPDKYSATDKADGKKNILFVIKNEVYLIDNNLNVKSTGIKVKGLDNTILEGELIFLPKEQVFLMMTFDILYFKGENMMNQNMLKERLLMMIEAINMITGKKEKLVEDYDGEFKLSKIRLFYQKQIKNFYDDLDKEINKVKKGDIIIKPKLFLFPSGGSSSEVFMFSDLIWESCTENKDIKCPYQLDGIIYTGLDQKYTPIKRDWKLPIYKFKPPSQNSLDVYLIFPVNPDTGDYFEIFDNSQEDKIADKVFRVANFYVGDTLGNKEVPVPFMKDDNNFEAFFPVENNQIRDSEGDIIQNKTVVEITYNNDPTVPHQFRWQILRTRWDKTESVNRHQKRYGNFRDVAIKTWKSMKEAVTWDEIKALANPDSYTQQMKQLENKLDTTIISSDRQQDAYYQKVSNLCKPMRKFHNWVKSILIYTHCAKKKKLRTGKEERLAVLDIGSGRGGDIMKMYHPRVGYYVGLEPNYENIYSPKDGAVARYKIFKSKFPDFPKMEFVQADAGVPLSGSKQKMKLGNMKAENVELVDKIFSKKQSFDLINSMFAIHYLFADDSSLENVCQNINDNLKPGGFIILTLFDGDRIHKLLDKSPTFTSYYTDEEGKRSKLFEIIKKYDSDKLNKTGLPIDVHMAWISEEGKYETEYIVSKEFMIDTMKKKCNAHLIETDLFENVFNLNQPYFEEIVKVEENLKNRKVYQDVAEFYGDLTGADKESKKYSFLFRYYVFQRKY